MCSSSSTSEMARKNTVQNAAFVFRMKKQPKAGSKRFNVWQREKSKNIPKIRNQEEHDDDDDSR